MLYIKLSIIIFLCFLLSVDIKHRKHDLRGPLPFPKIKSSPLRAPDIYFFAFSNSRLPYHYIHLQDYMLSQTIMCSPFHEYYHYLFSHASNQTCSFVTIKQIIRRIKIMSAFYQHRWSCIINAYLLIDDFSSFHHIISDLLIFIA